MSLARRVFIEKRKLILPMLRLGSPTLIADSRAMATAVRASGLDWTVVRAPRITRGESTGTARVGALAIGPWSSVVNAEMLASMLHGAAHDDLPWPSRSGAATVISGSEPANFCHRCPWPVSPWMASICTGPEGP